MEKLIEKIDSYNIFTNLIPGFLLLMFNVHYFNLKEFSIAEQIILSYFIGQTLNRLGSLLIGKILLKFTKEKGEKYSEYIKATKNDVMIEKLLQERNTFRTICTLLIVCIIEIPLNKVIGIFKASKIIVTIIILIIITIIYALSFCKYNKYIADRVRNSNKKLR